MSAMGRGGGKTPKRVVEKIQNEVARIGQNATARAIGIPLRSVQKYLEGKSEPTTATLETLAEYFGVSIAYLRGEAEVQAYNAKGTWVQEIVDEEAEDIEKLTDETLELYQVAPLHLKQTVSTLAVYLERKIEGILLSYVAGVLLEHESTYKKCLKKLSTITENKELSQ